MSGLFNLRLPAGGKFSGTDLRVAVKVYGTITNAAALTATHMPRWVRAYKAGVRPMRMPGISWNTGATGLRQHFEKHACGQHTNPDPAEPYLWVTYLGYSSKLTKSSLNYFSGIHSTPSCICCSALTRLARQSAISGVAT